MRNLKKSIVLIFSLLLLPLIGYAQTSLMPDTVLGDGFEMRYVDQGKDYTGKVRSTIIRKLVPAQDKCKCGDTHRGVLYIHGYNDYFFQREMANEFVDSCYNFYAVDLRRYGRSLKPGDRKFEVRNLREYFPDIDSAIVDMKNAGIDDIVLMAHSTGGLIASLYMTESPDKDIRAMVLNSPFLDWNLSGGMRNFLVPAVDGIGSIFPNIRISNGDSTAYGESLLKNHHGEWEYNTDWKTFEPEKVSLGWIKAIDEAQEVIQKNPHVLVPVLLMHSDKSVYGDEWTPEFQQGDAVLNVEHISKYGRKLGPSVDEVVIPNGLHDLMLSAPTVRRQAMDEVFNWLK